VPSLQRALELAPLFGYLDDAVRDGDVGAENARQWRAWIEAADGGGKFLMCTALFRVLATKPRPEVA
jgi:hypothetical protein